MKGKQKIALCLVFLPLAIGLLAWWHWASQTVMRIKNYDTQHIYVEFPAKAGDRLFFGWIHSLEHIHWHEYFHIAPDHSLILDTILPRQVLSVMHHLIRMVSLPVICPKK